MDFSRSEGGERLAARRRPLRDSAAAAKSSTDAELERILEASAAAGASSAGYVLLRLPLEVRQIFEEWLNRHYPERAAPVLALVRQTRGGKLYDARFGRRQTGEGPCAELP